MSWRSLKCCVAMVLLCVGVGCIFVYGLAWGVECNTKRLENNAHCDAGYHDLTYCSQRLATSAQCTLQPGAAGDFVGGSGPEWSPGCHGPGVINTDHCVVQEEANCLQKYNCVEEGGQCQTGPAYTIEGEDTYYQSRKGISPSCTPAVS
jgi:hypothetical protein